MSGRGLTLWCRLWNHGEPLWAVEARGHGWRCPDCLRFRLSRALRREIF